MTPEIHIDLETRSAADLKKTGLYVYAEHPTTDVWCACWCIDDGPIHTWLPGDPFPSDLGVALFDGAVIVAHNAGFEHALWTHVLAPRYGWPDVPFDAFRCTAAMAAAMALPRDLAGAAIAMGLEEQKDMSGKRLMMQMAKPRRIENGVPVWWDVPAKLERLIDYCKQDVEVERALTKKLRPLSEAEHAIWQLDHKINTRGVKVDIPSVKKADALVKAALDELNREIAARTQQRVTAASQAARLTEWLREHGVDVESVDKAAIKSALLQEMTPNVRRVLEIRQQAAKSSTAKLEAFRGRTSPDGRMRENLMYHGAATGRWSGKGAQLQNLPRPGLENSVIEQAFGVLGQPAAFALLCEMHDSPALSTIADCLRGMVAAEAGMELVAADFANIEGRVLAWLAGEEQKLDAFRRFDAGTGPDLYKLAAGAIYRCDVADVSKEQRQIGKVSELALGYQGGKGAFISMAALYGIEVDEDRAEEIKLAWRAANPNIVQFWYDLDDAAMAAVSRPGQVCKVGPVQYAVKGGIMWCKLPSGRLLSYVDPKIREVETPWGATRETVTYMGVNSVTRRWERQKGYGGLFCENITQAVARDIMADAMLRVEQRGWPVVLTVHDEIVSEVPAGSVSAERYARTLSVLPAWAEGLPVAAEGVVSKRYRK
jgi:DNA polymerase